MKLKYFIISDTKNGIEINDRNYLFSIKYSIGTAPHGMLKYLIEQATPEELEEILSILYYAVAGVPTDINLAFKIRDYYLEKLKIQSPVPDDKKQEEIDIEAVKQIQKMKEYGSENREKTVANQPEAGNNIRKKGKTKKSR